MRRNMIRVLAIASVGLGAVVAAQATEIEVRKHRSFLETGNVVPVGTENHYVVDSARLNYDAPGGAARRDELHQNLLPHPGEPIYDAPH